MKDNYYLFDGNFIKDEFIASNYGGEIVVYEVLRIVDGVPLFFEEHFIRLQNSCKILDKILNITANNIYSQIIDLSLKNKKQVGNIMIKVLFDSTQYKVLIYFISHIYPSSNDYINGVELGMLSSERINPEAKVEQPTIRNIANKIIKEKNIYEVLLVDNEGAIREGSRSNVLFIKQNQIYTCPLNKVLSGITMLKVLEIAAKLKIEVLFKSINKTEINEFDAVFITGTSPKILPVSKIEAKLFNTQHPIIITFINEYNQLIDNYINNKKGFIK